MGIKSIALVATTLVLSANVDAAIITFDNRTDFETYVSNCAVDELESIILDKAREMARKLYRSLEDEYNAMTKDDCVADHILANEYLYWSNGHPALFP